MSYERLDLGLEYFGGFRAPVIEQVGYGVVVDPTGLNVEYVAMYGDTDGRPTNAPDGWSYYDTDVGGLLFLVDGTWTSAGNSHTVTSVGSGSSIVHATSATATAFRSLASASGVTVAVDGDEITFTFDADVLPANAKALVPDATFSADFTFAASEYQICDATGALELDLDDTGAVLFTQAYKYIPANQIDSLTATAALSADEDVFANFDATKPYGVLAVWLPPGVPWVTGMVLPA